MGVERAQKPRRALEPRLRPRELLEHGARAIVDVALEKLRDAPEREATEGALVLREAREEHAGGAVRDRGRDARIERELEHADAKRLGVAAEHRIGRREE